MTHRLRSFIRVAGRRSAPVFYVVLLLGANGKGQPAAAYVADVQGTWTQIGKGPVKRGQALPAEAAIVFTSRTQPYANNPLEKAWVVISDLDQNVIAAERCASDDCSPRSIVVPKPPSRQRDSPFRNLYVQVMNTFFNSKTSSTILISRGGCGGPVHDDIAWMEAGHLNMSRVLGGNAVPNSFRLVPVDADWSPAGDALQFKGADRSVAGRVRSGLYGLACADDPAVSALVLLVEPGEVAETAAKVSNARSEMQRWNSNPDVMKYELKPAETFVRGVLTTLAYPPQSEAR